LRPNRHASILAPLGKVPGIKAGALISNPGPDMVNGKPGMNHHHHFDAGSDNDTCDPANWSRASYTPHIFAELGEPLPDKPNGYREAALYHLQLMYVVDDFLSTAEDSRLAVVAVAVVLGWPSARGLTLGNIADQLGCSPSTLTRCIARFKTLAGLGSAGGIRPGAGPLNGDKPAAVKA
jgi:AraC-like DNA-binding protein